MCVLYQLWLNVCDFKELSKSTKLMSRVLEVCMLKRVWEDYRIGKLEEKVPVELFLSNAMKNFKVLHVRFDPLMVC